MPCYINVYIYIYTRTIQWMPWLDYLGISIGHPWDRVIHDWSMTMVLCWI